MNSISSYSRRSLLVIVVFMALLVGMIAAAINYGTTFFSRQMAAMVTPEITPPELISQISLLHTTSGLYLIYAAAGIFLLAGIVLWLILRSMAGKIAAPAPAPAPAPKKAQQAPQPKDEKKPGQDQRLFLHLLSVLQKEGRLVDFLQEDLEMYEDEQIGAAVRTIHAGCRKTLEKSLAMSSVLDENEGDPITIVAGFNPEAIKLTGRVTGEPPFTGIVRHKGWRAQKANLPELAATRDPMIIAPAEVEIE